MERRPEGEVCRICRRDEVGLLECQDCHQWIVNVRTRDLRRLCAECARGSTSELDSGEIETLVSWNLTHAEHICEKCGRDNFGYNCCAKCGEDIIHRLSSGVRLCADCTLEEAREGFAEAATAAAATVTVGY